MTVILVILGAWGLGYVVNLYMSRLEEKEEKEKQLQDYCIAVHQWHEQPIGKMIGIVKWWAEAGNIDEQEVYKHVLLKRICTDSQTRLYVHRYYDSLDLDRNLLHVLVSDWKRIDPNFDELRDALVRTLEIGVKVIPTTKLQRRIVKLLKNV